MTKLFTPNSTDLNNMIAAAMTRCARDIEHCKEQAELRQEAQKLKRMERIGAAIAHGRAMKFWQMP